MDIILGENKMKKVHIFTQEKLEEDIESWKMLEEQLEDACRPGAAYSDMMECLGLNPVGNQNVHVLSEVKEAAPVKSQQEQEIFANVRKVDRNGSESFGFLKNELDAHIKDLELLKETIGVDGAYISSSDFLDRINNCMETVQKNKINIFKESLFKDIDGVITYNWEKIGEIMKGEYNSLSQEQKEIFLRMFQTITTLEDMEYFIRSSFIEEVLGGYETPSKYVEVDFWKQSNFLRQFVASNEFQNVLIDSIAAYEYGEMDFDKHQKIIFLQAIMLTATNNIWYERKDEDKKHLPLYIKEMSDFKYQLEIDGYGSHKYVYDMSGYVSAKYIDNDVDNLITTLINAGYKKPEEVIVQFAIGVGVNIAAMKYKVVGKAVEKLGFVGLIFNFLNDITGNKKEEYIVENINTANAFELLGIGSFVAVQNNEKIVYFPNYDDEKVIERIDKINEKIDSYNSHKKKTDQIPKLTYDGLIKYIDGDYESEGGNAVKVVLENIRGWDREK